MPLLQSGGFIGFFSKLFNVLVLMQSCEERGSIPTGIAKRLIAFLSPLRGVL